MARKQSIYQKGIENAKKNLSANIKGASSNSMTNSIGNYKTRLSSMGINHSTVTDKRNSLEKFLNLPEDQNALFDIFEILGRPQQALFGAIQSAQEGGDILEGARSGITGEQDYYFGDILRNAGVSDEQLFVNPLSGESVSQADLFGLAGDVFLDPIDIPLFALKPVDAAGKVIKGVDTATDVAKAADKAADAVRYAYKFDPLAALTSKGSKSLLEAATGGLAKGIKGAVKGGVNAAINAADLKTIKNLALDNNLIKEGTKITKDMAPDLIEKLGKLGVDVPLKADALSDIGKSFNRAFNYKASIPGDLYDTVTRSNNALDMAEIYGKGLNNQALESIENYAKKVGKSTNEIDDAIQLYIDSKYLPKTGVNYYVENALKNGGKSDLIRGSKEEIRTLKKAVENFVEKTPNITEDAIRVVPVKGGAKIEGKKQLLGAIYNNKDMMKSLKDIKFSKALEVDDDIAKQIKLVNKQYKTDSDFRKLVNDVKSNYIKYSQNLKGVTEGSVDYTKIARRKGYTDIALTDEGKEVLNDLKREGINVGKGYDNREIIGEGSKSAFKGRTQSPIAQQRQRDFERSLQSYKENVQSKIDNLTKQKENYIGTRKDYLKNEIEKLNLAKESRDLNARSNIAKLKISKQKQTNLVKKYNSEIGDLKDLINNDVLKKAPKVSNPKLVDNLSKYTDNYVAKIQNLDSIKLKLAQPNLTSKQIDAYTKQLDKAYNSAIKAKVNIIDSTAKIKGAVEESYIKEAGKLADKMVDKSTKLQEKVTKTQIKETKALDKIEQAKKTYTDLGQKFKKQQANLKLQLEEVERLAKNPKEVQKQVEFISNELAENERILSVIERNEGKQLFANSFTQGFDNYMNKTTKEAKAMKNYNEVLLKTGLNNEDVLKFVNTGEKVKVSPNMVKVRHETMNDFISYLDNMKGIMPENNDLIKQLKNKVRTSKEIFMDKDALEMIAFKTTKNDANKFLKTMDNVNNLFKKTSTISPGTQLRNAMGNGFNMWASGVPMNGMAKSYARSIKLSNSNYIVDLVNKSAKGTLTATEAADWKVVKQFIQSGAMGSGKNIRDLGELIEKAAKDKESANLLKKAWNGIFEVSAKANEKVDNISRMALLSYASENPKYIAKLGAKDAIDAMHQVLFDPQNLSPFEKKYMKRLIPFYTFTKQNLMFQMKNVVNNTTKYNRLMKTFNKVYDAVGEDNYRQYQKENFEIPLFNTDNGLVTVKSNLPFSDLGEYLENPLQRLVSSTTPLIKTPFEQVTGVDTFTGRDISDRSALQAILDTTGLNNLTTKQYEKLEKLVEAGDVDLNTLINLFPSVFRTTDSSKIANQNQYEELMAYQDYIKQLKAQGIDVPTVKEITNSTNRALSELKKRRNKILKRRSS